MKIVCVTVIIYENAWHRHFISPIPYCCGRLNEICVLGINGVDGVRDARILYNNSSYQTSSRFELCGISVYDVSLTPSAIWILFCFQFFYRLCSRILPFRFTCKSDEYSFILNDPILAAKLYLWVYSTRTLCTLDELISTN